MQVGLSEDGGLRATALRVCAGLFHLWPSYFTLKELGLLSAQTVPVARTCSFFSIVSCNVDIVWSLGFDLSGVSCFRLCLYPPHLCVCVCLWTHQGTGVEVREPLWKAGFLPPWDPRMKLKASDLHDQVLRGSRGLTVYPGWPGTGYRELPLSVSGTGTKGVLPCHIGFGFWFVLVSFSASFWVLRHGLAFPSVFSPSCSHT